MTVLTEVDVYTLRNLCWAGAKFTINLLTDDELLMILDMLDDCTYNMTMTQLNDFFWFDTDTIAEWLGYKDYEELYEERYINK